MRQNLSILNHKKICQGRVASELVIEKVLQCDQIIDQDFVGRLQRHSLGEVFPLRNGGLMQAFAEAVDGQYGNDKPAADYKREYGNYQFASKAF
jgi:hypothetical protein